MAPKNVNSKDVKPVGSPEAAKELTESKKNPSTQLTEPKKNPKPEPKDSHYTTPKTAKDAVDKTEPGLHEPKGDKNAATKSIIKHLEELTGIAKNVKIESEDGVKQLQTLAEKGNRDNSANVDIGGQQAKEINEKFEAYSSALNTILKDLVDKKSTLKSESGKQIRTVLEEIKTNYSAIAVKASKMTDRFVLKKTKEDTENMFGKTILSYSDGEPQQQGQVAKSKL